jgi:predicted transcriptional regulator of viral defense system
MTQHTTLAFNCGVFYHRSIMKLGTEQQIRDLISSHGGYIRADSLRENGIHSAKIAALVSSGMLIRLKRGLYTLADSAERSELVDIQRAVPTGVFCLGTALSLHGIGTWESPEVQLAIRRDYRITLPNLPQIRLFSFSGVRFELGIVEQATETGVVRVYDREKTICDIIRFRNVLGLDIAMEALKEYLKGRSRNIPRLLEYAKLLRMEGTMRGYLEALA